MVLEKNGVDLKNEKRQTPESIKTLELPREEEMSNQKLVGV